jgi:hypothetical protein
MVHIKSTIDDNVYLVIDLPDNQLASNMLSNIRINLISLTKYLHDNISKYDEYSEYINIINDRLIFAKFNENGKDSTYTSYSVNKGEQLVFCLRSKIDDKLHNINMVMYVALHELAHIGCPEYGHTELFKKIFKFFAETATKIGIYEKINFSYFPREYCGMMISDSII